MKKIISLAITLVIIFGFTGCGLASEIGKIIQNNSNQSSQGVEDIGNFVFDVPEGFFNTEDKPNTFFPPDYPYEGSTIIWHSYENDGSFRYKSIDTLKENFDTQMQEQYGTEISSTVLDDTRYEVDGCRVQRCAFAFEVSGHKIQLIQVMVEGPKEIYKVTYTTNEEDGYYDEFIASADSVRFEEGAVIEARPVTEVEVDETYNENAEIAIMIDIPEDYYPSEEYEWTWCPPNTEHLSDISINFSENDGSFSLFSPELVELQMEGEYENVLGKAVDIKVVYKDEYQIDGYDAMELQMEFDLNGVAVKQIEILIDGPDYIYGVVFTEYKNEGYYEEFKEIAKTIRF